MIPSDGSAHDGSAAPGDVPQVGPAAFIPMVLCGCLGWVRICAPQPRPRAACLAVTAYIHLLRPGIPLRDLDPHAEEAIRVLEAGAGSVTVIDDQHRVDRAGPCPPATPGGSPASG
jgi:hypothetical protein